MLSSSRKKYKNTSVIKQKLLWKSIRSYIKLHYFCSAAPVTQTRALSPCRLQSIFIKTMSLMACAKLQIVLLLRSKICWKNCLIFIIIWIFNLCFTEGSQIGGVVTSPAFHLYNPVSISRLRTWAEICRSQFDCKGFSLGAPVFLPQKFDFHATIPDVERLNISLWLGRMGNRFLRNWR